MDGMDSVAKGCLGSSKVIKIMVVGSVKQQDKEV